MLGGHCGMVLWASGKKVDMKAMWMTMVFMAAVFSGQAQQKGKSSTGAKHRAVKQKHATGIQVPAWAAAHNYNAKEHVYFPDYYTYYDPQRGGYVFWKNGKWSFSPSVPPYMEKVDLAKSRVEILQGLSLDLHPEQNYPNYMKLYPPVHEYNDVPVPGGNGQ